MSFNSKYTGQQVQDLLDRIKDNREQVSFSSSSIQLVPNKYYRLTSSQNSLTITLADPTDTTIVNEYFIEFPCSGTSVALPSNIMWINGITPTFEDGKTYQISIINNLAISAVFE